MHLWQLACVVYFLYIAILAVWRSPQPVERQSLSLSKGDGARGARSPAPPAAWF